jgi:DNA-directed RNA polymerase II subunit RPB4
MFLCCSFISLVILYVVCKSFTCLATRLLCFFCRSFDKAFQYVKEGNQFSTAQSVKQVLDPLRKYGVSDGEMCLIANVGPETIEEVYALVPSLKATRSLNESPIMEALTALADIKAAK